MREHQHIEWKESWRDEYLKWISGFANAEGGVLVIGRNDKGKVWGVPEAKKLLVDLPNKVMIWNPGQLPPDWTLDELTAKHASVPYNPDVASVFFRAALLESWGRGIDLIRNACDAHGSPPPQFRWDNGLWVGLPFMAGQETPEVTPEVQLLQIIRGAQSRVALQEALGLKDAEHFRQRYLLPALNAGLIERTVPEKPNSRLQKYRLTDKGRARLVDPKPEATE